MAKTYYVDNIAGEDANPGSAEASPWKTVDRVNRQQFLAGDVLLFKRGGEWFDVMIDVTSPDLTIGAYGTGAPPRLVGSVAVSDWQNRGNGIYSRHFPRPASRKEWTNWEVQLVMEPENRFYKRVESLEALTGEHFRDEWERFFDDSIWGGRFYYDKRSQTLFIKPLNPDSALTKTFFVGRQENVVEIKHAHIDRLVVRDVEIALANRYGIGVWWQGDKMTQGSVLVENNMFVGNAFSAVCLSGYMNYDRIAIRNNTIRMSGAEGIYIGKNAARTAVEITGNVVGDLHDGNFGWRGEGPTSAFNGDGIEVKTENVGVLIRGNTIRHLAISGCGICTGSGSALITENVIEDIRLPGSKWLSPAEAIFVDIDDRLGVPTIRHNRIVLSEAAGIHVRGNMKLQPPLVIEDNYIELTPTNPNVQILFSVMNSHNIKIIGNKCTGGAYGLVFAPADDPAYDYYVRDNDFLNTAVAPFYFAQPGAAEFKRLFVSSNRVCGNSHVFIEWKNGVKVTTIADAHKVLGPNSLVATRCPQL
ncbi:MAG TPA: right-handed parallel beta-helix repeat-containing protein [Thermodesulfovibrionales bacterium]|nr:right-handed parallel beta-helix repeat-containing protein [Thermodesulfovibrionales bacterium]